MPRQSKVNAEELVGAGSSWEIPPLDPSFTEEFADGALEWAESMYSTVPPYREGWPHIHHQDREEWLAGFHDLREPIESLAKWRERGLLSRMQADRFAALLLIKAEYDAIIADLAHGGGPPSAAARPAADEYDLLY